MKKYTEDHEWLDINDNIATVGITEHATTQLGDLVYVELPNINDNVSTGDEVAVIESVKAAGEVLAPCNGRIVEVNTALSDDPEMVSNTPESDGWLFKLEISDLSEIEAMLDRDAYEKLL
jgi:glycine cleavage system H protein